MTNIDNKPSAWAMDIARAAAHYHGTNTERSVRISDCAHLLDQEIEVEREMNAKLEERLIVLETLIRDEIARAPKDDPGYYEGSNYDDADTTGYERCLWNNAERFRSALTRSAAGNVARASTHSQPVNIEQERAGGPLCE